MGGVAKTVTKVLSPVTSLLGLSTPKAPALPAPVDVAPPPAVPAAPTPPPPPSASVVIQRQSSEPAARATPAPQERDNAVVLAGQREKERARLRSASNNTVYGGRGLIQSPASTSIKTLLGA